jgi:hypothetical protein
MELLRQQRFLRLETVQIILFCFCNRLEPVATTEKPPPCIIWRSYNCKSLKQETTVKKTSSLVSHGAHAVADGAPLIIAVLNWQQLFSRPHSPCWAEVVVTGLLHWPDSCPCYLPSGLCAGASRPPSPFTGAHACCFPPTGSKERAIMATTQEKGMPMPS